MAKAGTHIKQIFVFADWIELGGVKFMGTLQAEQVRGKEVFSFSYDKEWLQSAPALLLDPDLGLFAGPQYNRDEKPNFGLFTDSAPATPTLLSRISLKTTICMMRSPIYVNGFAPLLPAKAVLIKGNHFSCSTCRSK